MTTQPESILEENLIHQLVGLGYERVVIKDEADLIINLKQQLEKHNNTQYSDKEFAQLLNQLTKGNIVQKAHTLRDKLTYTKDNGDVGYVELINQLHWCQNQYQVTHQITIKGKYENRYDVTILVNGLPLVQIELKKRGLELKEAFNQTHRYQAHTFASGKGLFQFIQLFVISNGVNTKYYANNPIKLRSFKQTFFWADKSNKIISQLSDFAEVFLEPCHLSKMITKYIVINTNGVLMVLRPYQYYATEAIVERVKTTSKFGYIWHTTGSGKTLTSFKTSQILTNLPEVDKVVFVVDRKDLDYQTIKEFNSFKEGSVDATNNTKSLIHQFNDDTKLIVTTLQKLNNAVWSDKYKTQMQGQKDKKIVFIFDECHRTQFGDTHNRIKEFFTNAQMFGFTGTPILAENASSNHLGKRTTKDLFTDCLHKYVITDAIRDQNVLKFSIDYVSRFKSKDDVQEDAVENIDTQEVLEAEEGLEKVVDYIIANHDKKTHSKKFTAIMCVSSKELLIKYYELFKAKRQDGLHNLKIATIYSYGANEENEDVADGFYEDEANVANEDASEYKSTHSRDKLEEFIKDFNKEFKTNHSTNDFYMYYKDVGKKVKERKVDILLVVNMFLTGFDSKTLNTIYVDKNLQYHGLIQAFSRTNRILDEVKSQGQVVCFRNLKQKTDEAITLFSNKDAIDEIVLAPYDHYIHDFEKALRDLIKVAPTVESVDELPSEHEQLAFVKAFRSLMRIKNVLSTFADFDFEDMPISEQDFADYQSKYLDIRDRVKKESEAQKTSILNDIDFEVELIRRDEINVAYILGLLAQLNEDEQTGVSKEELEKKKKAIKEMLTNEVELRSKKELIEKFIEQHLPNIKEVDEVVNEFENYLNIERKEAVVKISKEEGLDLNKLDITIQNYLFTQKTPLPDEVINTMLERPKLKERKTKVTRVVGRIKDYVETFVNGLS
ncbi:type I restriction endonuclease subunit R [Wenyingzhuangia aestuarii]|uniref:type I restriction endonuclease subunit R n=1 Tax=Wenyingzhuangia aestuarii TaxID=1647582 RepID=UPI00143B1073|nr:type I restriction endonuclease subunit R [Wenyingzhuangia aestuarii]NJB82816.1 type I restriction enzyme R subunit [Wenyingzhuangia aestuarii]